MNIVDPMGNINSIPDTHVRIFKNLYSIRSSETRIQMIETLLKSSDHVESMKLGGIYGQLLHYVQQVKAGKAALLPGEKPLATSTSSQTGITKSSGTQILTKSTSEKGNERALNYFSACLRILELQEEVSLTDSALKKAYRKAALRSHPDKEGGSEKEFEAVTRAYAYLGEIIQRIHGGRSEEGNVEAPDILSGNRTEEAGKWKMVEPISLNPDKLDLNTFNSMFDKTRIPDPDDTGYGDWLKGDDQSSSVKFGGKFNRDVFHKAFEEEQRAKASSKQGGAIVAQELSMASRMGYGMEIGRSSKDDYTVSANDTGLQFTDLKKAYTEYTTFSQNTAGVQLQSKNLEQYTTERKSTPTALTDHERLALYEAEKSQLQAEARRKKRLAEESMEESAYFNRMQRLVIRN
jgi:curved DNA-binding protein CbpA